MANPKIPVKIDRWTQEGINDARDGSTRRPKDNPKRWVQQENRLAYKEAYDRECALLLIMRGKT